MAYATIEDLMGYLHASDAPEGAARLLERASELVDYVTFNRINPDDGAHLEAAKKAVCAQVESWLELGEQEALGAGGTSFAIGSFSMSSAQKAGAGASIAPRAKQALLPTGLLYRGVRGF